MDLHIALGLVELVIDGLKRRKGFDWWWEDLDDDVRDEIIDGIALKVQDLW